MTSAHVNGIDIAYETLGDPAAPPMLLIMGLNMQLVAWDDDLCAMLVERGFRVISFDNRDVGRSTWVEGPEPDLLAALSGDLSTAVYRLEDMADDAAGLLDVLGIGAAHVVGVSMGGMIGQTLAIRHPARVLTLTSIMSTTGDPHVGQPTAETAAALLTPLPSLERDVVVEHLVGIFRIIGSKGEMFDVDRVRTFAGRTYDRGYNPNGVGRHLLAILASGDRTERLRDLSVPTLVIHGEDDTLVTPSGGEATARAVPGSRLVMVPQMGHDMPRQLWPLIVDAITEHAAAATSAGPR